METDREVHDMETEFATGGVENCPFPLTKPVAVNTGLALPRSL